VSDLTQDQIVLGKLPRHLQSRRRRTWLGLLMASSVVVACSIAAYPLLPRTYLAMADMQIRPTSREGATTWDQSIAEALDDNAIQTKTDILRSQPMQQRVIVENNLLTDPEFNPSLRPTLWWRQQLDEMTWLQPWLPVKRTDQTLVETTLVKNLTIKRERKSYLLQLGYETHDPVKSAALANSLINAFLNEQIGRRRGAHDEVVKTLRATVDTQEQNYLRNLAAEHDYLVSSGLIHTGEKESMQQQLTALSTSLAEAHRRAIDTAARTEMLTKAQKEGKLDGTSETINSLQFQHLRQLLTELSTGTHGTGNSVAGANPGNLSSLRSSIAAEEQRFVVAAQNDATVAADNEVSLRRAVASLDAKLVQWHLKEWTLAELHRVVQTDLDTLAATRIMLNNEVGRGDVLQPDVEIVAQAGVPDRPYFPQPLLYASGTMALLIVVNGLILLPTILRASRAR